jgi:hypothetical protein
MDYDGRGFKQADQSVNGLTKGLGTMAIAMAGVAAAMGSIKLIGLGSDAQETLNVLNTSFGENTEAVQKWADQFAQDTKRSEFAMREMAGTLGAVLNPLMDRNREVAAEMSTTLAGLAVDLGSFFNKTDDQALNALRAGITGEAEALKQFGVVMNEATLAAFALDSGIRTNVKDMSIAEKTALRYNFILSQTADAQGDAAKTSLGWANATKGLEGGLKDLGTNIGLVMLPMAERVLNWVSELTRGFSRLVKESNIVQASLIVLGGIAAALALKLLIAFAPIILKFVLIGAAIAAAALIVEDFISFLQGKKSVIGEFINLIAGPGSAEEAANNLKLAFEGLVLYMQSEVFPAWQSLISIISFWKDSANESINSFFNNLLEKLFIVTTELQKFGEEIKGVLRAGAQFLGIDVDALSKSFEESWDRQNKVMRDTFQNRDFDESGFTGLTKFIMERAGTAGREQFERENTEFFEARRKGFLGNLSERRRKEFLELPGKQQASFIQREVSPSVAPKIEQNINVEIKGDATKKTADEIANKTAQAAMRVSKKTLKAVTQRTD